MRIIDVSVLLVLVAEKNCLTSSPVAVANERGDYWSFSTVVSGGRGLRQHQQQQLSIAMHALADTMLASNALNIETSAV